MQHGIRLAQFLTTGYTTFGAKGFLENAKSFNPKALDVDLTGRNVIVTGATSGLGKITAHELAKRNANIHLVVRSVERGQKVRDEIISSMTDKTPDIQVHECDMSSLSDISKLATHFKDTATPVHALVNNAGVMKPSYSPSADGYESAFATNTLGTFTLTEMLMPMLQVAQPSARVINISSGGMLTEKLYVDDLEGKSITKSDGKIDGPAQYSRCKRRQVALTEHWTRKYGDKSIFFASMHPGWADTPGLQSSMSDFYKFTKAQLRSEEQGADTIVYLAASDEVSSLKSGDFFFDRSPAPKHLKLAGTQYKDEEVDRLVTNLQNILKEKGYSLPQ